MSAVLADTHALIWYLREPTRLSATALAALRQAAPAGDPIYVASISFVEVCYLVEKGRLPQVALERLDGALDSVTTNLVSVPLDLAIARAVAHIPRAVVPDMPDRIVAATALHLNLPLVTRDPKIQAAPITTIW
jgi:PIN domain nuclease of toxin-antitoxin system